MTCKAFREQRAAGETYGHLASEKNEEAQKGPPGSWAAGGFRFSHSGNGLEFIGPPKRGQVFVLVSLTQNATPK